MRNATPPNRPFKSDLSPLQTGKPIDDTTKPSRINRRRKKRWRISDLIDSIFISLVESEAQS